MALLRVVQLVEARSREITITAGGTEVTDRVRLSDVEREEKLRMALTWLNQAEMQTRLLRTELGGRPASH